MNVLADTSVWIDYFKDGSAAHLDFLIEEGLVAVNELILAELIPYLELKRQYEVIALLREVTCFEMVLDWDGIVEMQVTCLRHGINKVGIPDLMIAQNAIERGVELYTMDKHFRLMGRHLPLKLYDL